LTEDLQSQISNDSVIQLMTKFQSWIIPFLLFVSVVYAIDRCHLNNTNLPVVYTKRSETTQVIVTKWRRKGDKGKGTDGFLKQ
jgi:hypothetical protein